MHVLTNTTFKFHHYRQNCPVSIPCEKHFFLQNYTQSTISYPVEAVQCIRAVEAVLERDDENGVIAITCHVYKRWHQTQDITQMNNQDREGKKQRNMKPCENEQEREGQREGRMEGMYVNRNSGKFL